MFCQYNHLHKDFFPGIFLPLICGSKNPFQNFFETQSTHFLTYYSPMSHFYTP